MRFQSATRTIQLGHTYGKTLLTADMVPRITRVVVYTGNACWMGMLDGLTTAHKLRPPSDIRLVFPSAVVQDAPMQLFRPDNAP
jgi:hypothetical protein